MMSNRTVKLIIFAVLSFSWAKCYAANTPPNIIFIIADDLGWNDVSFHGSNQIPTPNIDALAYSGINLKNYYVSPICTPTRSSLMTGKYPIRMGMQHSVLSANEPRGLPLSEKLLPEYLKSFGYVNRMIGKWHLGFYKKEYTPTYRGFDSHLGCWTGYIHYYEHVNGECSYGLDFRRNMDIEYSAHGEYSTDYYTDEAVHIIEEHNTTEPLFLYIAHNAVHAADEYDPLPAPDELVAQFNNITDFPRRKFAGILSKLDESVGRVVQALDKADMLQNSVIVFTSDNGGPAAQGSYFNAASNWPLRGVKNTLWEGGVHSAGLLWSPLLKKPKRVAGQMMHIVDWLPTLLHVASGGSQDISEIDGVDRWEELSQDEESKRETILHNIDEISNSASVRVGNFKLISGKASPSASIWYGPSGRVGQYDAELVANSMAGQALKHLNLAADLDEISRLRNQSEITCDSIEEVPCNLQEAPCLFNVIDDPCERRNVADLYPEEVKKLQKVLADYSAIMVPASNLPVDPAADPKHWNYVWTNFGDYV